jgi:hypothetical protein
VIFKEAGAHAFIKEPLYELFGDSVPLDNFTSYQNVSMIEEQLAGATDNTQRIDVTIMQKVNKKPKKKMSSSYNSG